MAATLTTSPIKSNFDEDMSLIAELQNLVSDQTKNVRGGPTILTSLNIDNLTASSNKVWVKLFDISDDSFVAGTSKPIMVFPCRAVAGGGLLDVKIEPGFEFKNGLSILASEEDGDSVATIPSQQLDVRFTTKKV